MSEQEAEQMTEDPIAARKRMITEAKERQEAELARIQTEEAALAAHEAEEAAAAGVREKLSEREQAINTYKEAGERVNEAQSESEALKGELELLEFERRELSEIITKREDDLAEYNSTLEEARALGIPEDPQFLERLKEAETKFQEALDRNTDLESRYENARSRFNTAGWDELEADDRIEEITPGRVEDIKTPEQRAAVDALHEEALSEDQERNTEKTEPVSKVLEKTDEKSERIDDPELAEKMAYAGDSKRSEAAIYRKEIEMIKNGEVIVTEEGNYKVIDLQSIGGLKLQYDKSLSDEEVRGRAITELQRSEENVDATANKFEDIERHR